MSDLDQIRQAILERPDDDGLRLIYADAAIEAGDERRADFIRLQVELAKLDRGPLAEGSGHLPGFCPCDLCRMVSLREHEQHWLESCHDTHIWASHELLNPCRIKVGGVKAWLAFDGLRNKQRQRDQPIVLWNWSRGWMCHIEMPHDMFLEHAKTIFEWQPITRVRLLDKNPASPINPWVRPRPFMWACYAPFRAIQRPLANELADDLAIRSPVQMLREFVTHGEANAALSLACVAHGRRLAGLPPIKQA